MLSMLAQSAHGTYSESEQAITRAELKMVSGQLFVPSGVTVIGTYILDVLDVSIRSVGSLTPSGQNAPRHFIQ